MTSKTIGIIPARYDSSRFPGKPLVEIQGQTMISRVYYQAIQSKSLSDVYIATDDDRIFSHCQALQIPVLKTVLTHFNGTTRCHEALTQLAKRGAHYDFLVNIQGDEPLIHPESIDILVEKLCRYPRAIASLYHISHDLSLIQNPNKIKVVTDFEDKALYFSRSAVPYRQASIDLPYKLHIGMYGFDVRVLNELVAKPDTNLEKIESLEQLKWLYYGYSIYMSQSDFPVFSVDTPEDISPVLAFLNRT
ncbi:MAG: 3-deoxy-manno-octulosonate cytidylyltransferase [Chitinophagales bacterium]|jgi:3-deoxy-manno-octulosonate cytidylyltransferase (CMP-KDO synthetase)|nr:3-deoxy-manno-octulosonate cytidylyltransferase [Chitinophagales bacterium]